MFIKEVYLYVYVSIYTYTEGTYSKAMKNKV